MAARWIGVVGALLGIVAFVEVTRNISAPARHANEGPDTTSSLTYSLNRAHPPALWPSWRVMQANSAHNVLVVDVDAQRVEQARQIADQIVEPVRSRGYHEILIYVRETGNPDGAMRRVQWTPRRGFVESAYAAVPPGAAPAAR